MSNKCIKVEVEFEDLDAGGVVYHPNYIKLCERARSRWFQQHGIEFMALKQMDVALAVRAIKADYLRPILLEPINIKMQIIAHTEKSITILHQFYPLSSTNQTPHFSAEITLVAANYSTGKSCPLPDDVKKMCIDTSESLPL
jgi:acyl-CoA thioester hydrolase